MSASSSPSLPASLSVPMLLAKIHRATVTHADLHYEGSLTIDSHLMETARLLPHQQIQVYNITNGQRFETYAIPGEAHSGTIQVNGAAAHLTAPGDLIIIAMYGQMAPEDATDWEPTVVLVDGENRPADVSSASGQPLPVG